jgi:hypothetical protein
MESASEAAAHAGATADPSTAKAAAHVHPAQTAARAGESTAEAAVAAAKSSSVTAAKAPATSMAAASTSASARLRIGCQQAAGQSGGHQHSQYSSQHGYLLCLRRCIRHGCGWAIDLPHAAADRSTQRACRVPRRRRFRNLVTAGSFLRPSPTQTVIFHGGAAIAPRSSRWGAKAVHVAPIKPSAVEIVTAIRLRISCQQAASQRGRHQRCHHSSQHGFLPLHVAVHPPWV